MQAYLTNLYPFLGSISVSRDIGNFFDTYARQVVLQEFAGALRVLLSQ
jgi:hypothetical protein